MKITRAKFYRVSGESTQHRGVLPDVDFPNILDATEELFKIALKQPHPMKALNADYGRFLLVAKRPKDAQPVLEQAVKDAPDFADAWTNLAWARFQNGDQAAACAAAGEATKQRPSATSANDLTAVMNAAQCK